MQLAMITYMSGMLFIIIDSTGKTRPASMRTTDKPIILNVNESYCTERVQSVILLYQ